METVEYQVLANKTESMPDEAMIIRASDPHYLRLRHAGDGFATEAGEFIDVLKRYLFYGKSIDRVNAAEELGDIMWYIALACNELGITIASVMEVNITKLQKRFPDKFDAGQALNRDLVAERAELEKQEFIKPGQTDRM